MFCEGRRFLSVLRRPSQQCEKYGQCTASILPINMLAISSAAVVVVDALAFFAFYARLCSGKLVQEGLDGWGCIEGSHGSIKCATSILPVYR